MALRARLAAPPLPPPVVWPYHTPKWTAVSVRQMTGGDRRMEAETYLSQGFGIRAAIEAKHAGWTRLGNLARVWMPARLKGIQVSREFGTPFLAATQVYDVRPIPRKWLSLNRTDDATTRFVRPGTILVTCSGSVGRPTLAYAPLENTLISHDLLRVETIAARDHGWLYAYLHAPQVRAMTTGVHYGHMIKHLETSHLDVLPVPTVKDAVADDFTRRVNRILELRNEGFRLTLEAEAEFEKALGAVKVTDWGEKGFTVKASTAFLQGRRRFDASAHNPGAAAIRAHLAKHGNGFTTVRAADYKVWVPGRYKRIPAEDGVIYRDSADLLEVSPDLTKRFADCRFGDDFRGRVKSGWILIACSGQVYGIIGTAVLATEALDGQVVSNHVLRVAPGQNPSIRAGYLVTALSHVTLGRPLMKSLAFGSSVPEIDSEDVDNFEVVRLEPHVESAIADLVEASTKASAEADLLERAIAQDAATLLDRFING